MALETLYRDMHKKALFKTRYPEREVEKRGLKFIGLFNVKSSGMSSVTNIIYKVYVDKKGTKIGTAAVDQTGYRFYTLSDTKITKYDHMWFKFNNIVMEVLYLWYIKRFMY